MKGLKILNIHFSKQQRMMETKLLFYNIYEKRFKIISFLENKMINASRIPLMRCVSITCIFLNQCIIPLCESLNQ